MSQKELDIKFKGNRPSAEAKTFVAVSDSKGRISISAQKNRSAQLNYSSLKKYC